MAMLRPDELPLQRQTRCRQDLIEMGQRFTHRQVKTMSTDDQSSPTWMERFLGLVDGSVWRSQVLR